MTLKQYNMILEKWSFYFKAILHDLGENAKILSWQMIYNKILEKENFYFKAILHDFGKKGKIFVLMFLIFDLFIYFFFKEFRWQMTLKQYNTILESKTFTLKQYYMVWGKMQNFCFHFPPMN